MSSPGTDESDGDNVSTSIGHATSEDAILTRDELITNVGSQLDAIDCAGSFSVYATTNTQMNPGLEVEGLGRFGTPLYHRDVQILKQKSRQAPFGKGVDTMVDTAVRNTWEIDASQVKFTHPEWKRQEQSILESVCTNLGVSGGSRNVRAELYKLLIYEEGAHFKRHRDSEKASGMFATMVICLPSAHQGGDVVVTFGRETKVLSTARHAEWTFSYLAWYSDVLHEVRPVQSGARIVLTYNLLYQGQEGPPNPLKLEEEKVDLRRTLRRWRRQVDCDENLPEYLAYPLQHEYSEANLKLAHLKLKDKARAVCASQIADELGLHCFLALISKTVTCQEWDDERDEDDDDMHCSVLDFSGAVLLTNLNLPQNILATDEPWANGAYNEEEGGWTGNAGAETTYWYKDCALLLIPKLSWVRLQLDSNSLLDGKKQVIRDHLGSLDPASLQEEDKTFVEYMLKSFLEKGPSNLSWYSVTQSRQQEEDESLLELLESCVRLELVVQMASAVRSADPEWATGIIRQAHAIVPHIGFDSIAPCLEAAMQQKKNLQDRTELLWQIEAAMSDRSDDSFTQWKDRQTTKSLTMPLGQIEKAVPILIELAMRSQASTWLEQTLCPALQGRTSDAKILFHFASDLLAHGHSGHFPLEKAVEAYSVLLPAMTQGMVFTVEAPRHYHWRYDSVSTNERPFGSDDLVRLLGNLLAMRRLRIMPDVMQYISHLHRKLTELATTTTIPNLQTVLIPYLKACAELMSSNGISPTEPSFQYLFASVIHQVVYRYVSQEPQPAPIVRPPRGCRNCQSCNQLDAILQSSQEMNGGVFVRFKKDVSHLNTYFARNVNGHFDRNERGNITTNSQTQRMPYSFEITKVDGAYQVDFQRWQTRFRETSQLLCTIAPEDILRQLLGQRFDELVLLHGTILVRTPGGAILSPPMYLHQRPHPQIPLIESGAASSSTTEVRPSSSGTLKRKDPIEDQENREPSAKRTGAVDVVDLSVSP